MTPLLMAITNGQLAVAQFLVDKGAECKAADWYGRTPLWAAVDIRNLRSAQRRRRRTASIAKRRCG